MPFHFHFKCRFWFQYIVFSFYFPFISLYGAVSVNESLFLLWNNYQLRNEAILDYHRTRSLRNQQIDLETLTAAQGITITGEASSHLGVSVSNAGDVNGDGKADILIGANSYSSSTGRAYLLYGGASLTSSTLSDSISGGVVFTGEATSSCAGTSVSLGGDVNGDGYGDMLIGAFGYSSTTGRVYLIYGGTSLTNLALSSLGTQGISITGPTTGYYFGLVVSLGGDVNGDGKADMLIGAPIYSSNIGRVYLIFGGSSLSNIDTSSLTKSQGMVILGESSGSKSGYFISIGGDINKDGYADIMVGTVVGRAYLLFGGSTSSLPQNISLAYLVNNTSSRGIKIQGQAPFGTMSVSVGGDVNGDTYPDFLIGSPGELTQTGRVYLLYGGPSLGNIDLSSLQPSQGITITGENTNYQTGFSICIGKDVNGDGFADFIFGSNNFKYTYLIYGGASLTNIALANGLTSSQGVFITRESTSINAVSMIGDVNGDSKADILLGAFSYGSDMGRSYLIYGSSSLSNLIWLGSPAPSSGPTGQPSRHPTSQPSNQPTCIPTAQPTRSPAFDPTSQPSTQPSKRPSSQPTQRPTSQPSTNPTRQPTSQPSRQPSSQPSRRPISSPTSQPSSQPSKQPVPSPTSQPSQQPASNPSTQPTRQPTCQPSSQPTQQPFATPTTQPTAQPSWQPTSQPTSQPSVQPSTQPSRQPTSQPSSQPTRQPSCSPSSQPTALPTRQPTRIPSGQPSSRPSPQPSSPPSRQPTTRPTSQPSSIPTLQPTRRPSGQPTTQPTSRPSSQPTSIPTRQPTAQPTQRPSSQPTTRPSTQPTSQPTRQPTRQPSSQPTQQPFATPTTQPTNNPTTQPSNRLSAQPSGQPTSQPTTRPTTQPSVQPSTQPSRQPILQPSSQPTRQPSSTPTAKPTGQPTSQPSVVPSEQPTSQPSQKPSSQPSRQPTSSPSTSRPSSQPSSRPSSQPTCQPSGLPSTQPTRTPISQPTQEPSSQPSSPPSRQPTTRPTSQPSSIPTMQPTRRPSGQPTTQPTSRPSSQPTSIPTRQPTAQPTQRPSSQPTTRPSTKPTSHPTQQPYAGPTAPPTNNPTSQPSTRPSAQPSGQPTSQPTTRPTTQPSVQPSTQPSRQPVAPPSSQPTRQPSPIPSVRPTGQPTFQPSRQPSSRPTRTPSSRPTNHPSLRPTNRPTYSPSLQPTCRPSSQPTSQPSAQPSYCPTSLPSSKPSTQPSLRQSAQPSSDPTQQPITLPREQPSSQPTLEPTNQPTSSPSNQPTEQSKIPTSAPSSQPSFYPSTIPSNWPTCLPSSGPSVQPSTRPSTQPTTLPTSLPTCLPTLFPSAKPSSCPSNQPTCSQSGRPSSQPSSKPSGCPSTQQPSQLPTTGPSRIPTSHPTGQPRHQPANSLSSLPSSCPTGKPTSQPTTSPCSQPRSLPTGRPCMQPTGQPTTTTTTHPSSSAPSAAPTEGSRAPTPIRAPSITLYPTETRKPTRRPTPKPTQSPTLAPTSLMNVLPVSYSYEFRGALFFLGGNGFGSSADSSSIQTNPLDLTKKLTTEQQNFVIFGSSGKDYPPRLVLGSAQSRGYYAQEPAPVLSMDTINRCATIVEDFNGDQLRDLFVGHPESSQVLVYLGRSSDGFSQMAVSSVIYGVEGEGLGWAIEDLGDINGDGLSDVMVSAVYRGVVYIVYGRSNIEGNNIFLENSFDGFRIIGGSSGFTGTALACLDFNGDGVKDFVVSSLGSSAQGKVQIVYGNSLYDRKDVNLDDATSMTILFPPFSFAGFSIAGVGDMNGDGYEDLAIGSVPYQGGFLQQVTYVIYGRSSQGQGKDLLVNKMTREDGFVVAGGGFMVNKVGDLNGDGLADLLVSSYRGWEGTTSGGYRGNAYLVHFPSNMTSAPTLLPSSFPTSVPTSLPTAWPSISPAPTNLPTIATEEPTFPPLLNESWAPILRPTARPTIQRVITNAPVKIKLTNAPSRFPSAAPSTLPTLSPSTLSCTPTIIPSRKPWTYKPSSSRRTIAPTATTMPTINYLDVLTNQSIPSMTLSCSLPGSYVGSPTANNQFIISGEGNYQLTSAPYKINVFVFKPLANTAIFFGFQPELDRINLSKFPGIESLKDISYTTNPFTIYLSHEQILIFSGNNQPARRQSLTAAITDHLTLSTLSSSTTSSSSLSSASSDFPLTASNFIFSVPETSSGDFDWLQMAMLIGGAVIFTAVIVAARIAKKEALDAEDEEENKQKKDDSSSTSSDTLDYIRLSDEEEDEDDEDDETPSLWSLHDGEDDDNTNRIPKEQHKQVIEDSDFLLSELSWEGGSNGVDTDDSDDGNSVDGSNNTEEIVSAGNSMEPAAPLSLNNEGNSLDDPLSWSWYSQDDQLAPSLE